MKLLDKLKNLLYEDEEEQEEETPVHEEELVKKIDVTKSIKKEKPEIKEEPKLETRFRDIEFKEEEQKKGPIIFDDEDFMTEPKAQLYPEKEPEIKNDRILYGGYEEKKEVSLKEKFSPSPIISPVYGVLDKNYKKEEIKEKANKKSLDHLFVEERKKTIDLDSVREKAFNVHDDMEEEPEEKSLLYDISKEDKPAIDKITLGDAEEYFEDLGLEYDIDYKDSAKEKMTRRVKNKELTDMVEEEIKEEQKIEEETGKQIEEIIPTEEEEIVVPVDDKDDEPEEKNLYDLIDMMYDSKE